MSLFYICRDTDENSRDVNCHFVDSDCFVAAVGRDAVKSECDDALSVPTDKPVHSGTDSATAVSMATQQNTGAPPVKRCR